MASVPARKPALRRGGGLGGGRRPGALVDGVHRRRQARRCPSFSPWQTRSGCSRSPC